MRATFTELRIREEDGVTVYRQVEVVREGEPGDMALVEERDTDVTYPVAERLYSHGFYIPSGLGLSDDEQDQVCDIVRDVFA